LKSLPGVEKVHDFGQVQELRISQGADHQNILATLLKTNRLISFELMKPSLHDIFVRIADAKEVSDV